MKNIEENFLSVVIVVHNDNAVLAKQLELLFGEIAEKFKYFEIIIVDNFSKANIGEMLKGFTCCITVVTLPFEHSNQAALSAGVDRTVGDYVVEVPYIENADFSHIFAMYKECQSGYDFVFLTPKHTSFLSRAFYKLINRYFSHKINEKFTPSIMILSSRRGQNRIADTQSRIVNRNISYVMSGLKCVTIQSNVSQMYTSSFDEKIGYMLDTFVYHTELISHIMTRITIMFSIISFLALVYTLIMLINGMLAVELVLIMILIPVGFTVFSGIIMFICKYLSNGFRDAQKGTYTFNSVEKFGVK